MIIIHWNDGTKEKINTQDPIVIEYAKNWLCNRLKKIPIWEKGNSHFSLNLDNVRMIEIEDIHMD